MRVVAIERCCAGVQFVDWPGAHGINEPVGKALVLAALTNMYNYKASDFFVCYLNASQNQQHAVMFKGLGWKVSFQTPRITSYNMERPSEWWKSQGFNILTKANLYGEAFIKLHPSYKEYNERILKQIEEGKAARDKFYRAMKKKFGIEKSELAFLGVYD